MHKLALNKLVVLTSVLYEVDKAHEIYKKAEAMASKRKSIFVPIKLSVTEQENIKRITIPSRQERGKAIDPHIVSDPKTLDQKSIIETLKAQRKKSPSFLLA